MRRRADWFRSDGDVVLYFLPAAALNDQMTAWSTHIMCCCVPVCGDDTAPGNLVYFADNTKSTLAGQVGPSVALADKGVLFQQQQVSALWRPLSAHTVHTPLLSRQPPIQANQTATDTKRPTWLISSIFIQKNSRSCWDMMFCSFCAQAVKWTRCGLRLAPVQIINASKRQKIWILLKVLFHARVSHSTALI